MGNERKVRRTLAPSHREVVKTALLLRRLQLFALSSPAADGTWPEHMTATQVAAGLGLLKKTLPDLVAATLDPATGGRSSFVIMGAVEAETVEAWAIANPPPQLAG